MSGMADQPVPGMLEMSKFSPAIKILLLFTAATPSAASIQGPSLEIELGNYKDRAECISAAEVEFNAAVQTIDMSKVIEIVRKDGYFRVEMRGEPLPEVYRTLVFECRDTALWKGDFSVIPQMAPPSVPGNAPETKDR